MGRHRYRGGRGGGVPNLRDTPVKPAASRRAKCRRPVHNRYEDIPEESEVEQVKPVVVMVSLGSDAFKVDKRPVKVTTQNVTVTLGSITSSDTTFSSHEEEEDEEEEEEEEEEEDEEEEEEEEEDDDDNCYSSATSNSSLSSPEIFRRDDDETLTSFKDDLLGLHLHKRNSTLLDVSHAESLRLHHSPNLSNILDVSQIIAEKNCEIESKSRGPKAEPTRLADPFKPEKWKTPPTVRKPPVYESHENTMTKSKRQKPIVYKKKVRFQSPVKMELLEPEVSSKGASFFDFFDDADRDSFFKRMSERSEKLRSAPLFPLTALDS
ncbi:nucleolin isoform X2 [Clinocottus analis]|uniref:nucleolin isoform X2 n=1 Tax=Clinocottus analis TaxID=304258 RepID=UPI0035BFC193